MDNERKRRELYFKFKQSQDKRNEVLARTLDIPRLVDSKKWYESHNYKPEGKWDSVASQMVQRFKETGYPVFKSASALNRGWKRNHTLQCGCFEYRSFIPSHSLSKSAHYVRSSLKLV